MMNVTLVAYDSMGEDIYSILYLANDMADAKARARRMTEEDREVWKVKIIHGSTVTGHPRVVGFYMAL